MNPTQYRKLLELGLNTENLNRLSTMPKTFSVTTYKYNELSDAAKAKARDWFRQAITDDTYMYESVYEDAQTIAKLMGITIKPRNQKFHVEGRDGKPGRDGVDTSPSIFWSGFSSQGDGACFEGSWSASDVNFGGLKIHAPQDEELHRIGRIFNQIAQTYPEASFTVKHSGHYSHSSCTEFDCDPGNYEDHCEKLPETQGPCEAWEAAFPVEALIEAARDFMDWIYKQLETAYNYEQQDETVAGNIEANDYDFTIEGKRSVTVNVD